MTDAQSTRIKRYIALLEEFTSGVIDGPTFDALYIRKFKNEDVELPRDAFETLDRLFGEVDSYAPEGRGSTFDRINDDALRTSAKLALVRLKEQREADRRGVRHSPEK